MVMQVDYAAEQTNQILPANTSSFPIISEELFAPPAPFSRWLEEKLLCHAGSLFCFVCCQMFHSANFFTMQECRSFRTQSVRRLPLHGRLDSASYRRRYEERIFHASAGPISFRPGWWRVKVKMRVPLYILDLDRYAGAAPCM